MGDNNVCNDEAYKNAITQKLRFQLMNKPPVRYNNLANNPYQLNYPGTSNKFTKLDLDMRRKIEVLKYNANNSSTQTNRFTKAEIYAQAISGIYQQRTYPNYFITDNTKNNQLNKCPNIKTPTSSCGVPGPVIYLYEDDNVPLYNYTTNIDSNYGILTQGLNPYGSETWDFTKDYNKTVNNSNTNTFTSTITSLFIYYRDVPYKTFTITTPIALHFQGNTITSVTSQIMAFNISSITTNILYNNTIYGTTIRSSNHNFPTGITVTPSALGQFSGNCYLGQITIKNITVPIQKGFIFDIKTVITYTNNLTTNVNDTSLTTIFNVKSPFTRSSTNCTIDGDINPIGTIPDISITSTNS